MEKRPDIVITSGEFAGRRFEVTSGGLRLGRSSSNDIHIPDEELSRNHCLFEAVGESGVRLTDLASANGTFLNGSALGSDPAILKVGDEILVGTTTLRVGDLPAAQKPAVDLGLGAVEKRAKPSSKPRSAFANILWLVAALCILAAAYVVWSSRTPSPEVLPKMISAENPVLSEVQYEKVVADKNGIFRYYVSLSADGVLSVRIDDVPRENRHHVKTLKLSADALGEIGEILAYRNLKDIDREYVGAEPLEPALESCELRVVYDTRARNIRVINTQEPEQFRAIREKLESFTKSELGVWAIQYPREKLVELAEQALELGNAKWEERDVNHGNLAAAIVAYREALFYLETVNPKPACGVKARENLARTEAELATRYADQRFLADRALNLSQWETARAELQILLEMVPDRRDDRNRDARQKLLSAESNLKKKGAL